MSVTFLAIAEFTYDSSGLPSYALTANPGSFVSADGTFAAKGIFKTGAQVLTHSVTDIFDESTYSDPANFASYEEVAMPSQTKGMFLSSAGDVLYYLTTSPSLIQYQLSIARDFSTATQVAATNAADMGGHSYLHGSPDHDKLFVGSMYDDYVAEITMSTPGNLSTASITHTLDPSHPDGHIWVSGAGENMFIADPASGILTKTVLSAPWGLSSAGSPEDVLDVSAEIAARVDPSSGVLLGISLSPDQSRLVLLANNTSTMAYYALIYETPFGDNSFWTQFHGQEEIS